MSQLNGQLVEQSKASNFRSLSRCSPCNRCRYPPSPLLFKRFHFADETSGGSVLPNYTAMLITRATGAKNEEETSTCQFTLETLHLANTWLYAFVKLTLSQAEENFLERTGDRSYFNSISFGTLK